MGYGIIFGKATGRILIMNEELIKLDKVGMRFNLSSEKVDSLKEYFIKLVGGKLSYREFWALKDISLSIKRGERLGVMGLNGAGKSTLMKVIAGVFVPSEGTIERKGVIAPLIELGAGFDMQYTGRENVFLYGAVLGHSKKYMQERYEEIDAFADLGDFMEVPLKNYSSGMRARLGFAVAVMSEPDVLILDEVLSVGDVKFKKKSEARILSMIEKGITVIFVSHNTDQIKRICDRAIILDKGRIADEGPAGEIADRYVSTH